MVGISTNTSRPCSRRRRRTGLPVHFLSVAALAIVVSVMGGPQPASIAATAVVATAEAGPAEFAAPIRLVSQEKPIAVEAPGYAAPCWADFDRDGIKDLLVGQFSNGKIRFYKHLGDLKFAEGEWVQAEGQPAVVPGVW